MSLYKDIDCCFWCDEQLGPSAKRGRNHRLYCFDTDCLEKSERQDREAKAFMNGHHAGAS